MDLADAPGDGGVLDVDPAGLALEVGRYLGDVALPVRVLGAGTSTRAPAHDAYESAIAASEKKKAAPKKAPPKKKASKAPPAAPTASRSKRAAPCGKRH